MCALKIIINLFFFYNFNKYLIEILMGIGPNPQSPYLIINYA